MHFLFKLGQFSLAGALLLIAGSCGDGGKIRQLSDEELARKYADCLDHAPTAPGKATACENMRKECERRKEELDVYVCRSY